MHLCECACAYLFKYVYFSVHMCVCMCLRACVRACVLACVRPRVCVCSCARTFVQQKLTNTGSLFLLRPEVLHTALSCAIPSKEEVRYMSQ